jgi:hypothetical protein
VFFLAAFMFYIKVKKEINFSSIPMSKDSEEKNNIVFYIMSKMHLSVFIKAI